MAMIIVAFSLSLITCLLAGVPYIDFLKKNMFKQSIKSVAPKTHAAKEGTPTTGGVFIVASIIISSWITLLMAQKLNTVAQIMLFTLLFYAVTGFQDDMLKIKGKSNDGLSARGKLIRQILIALLPTIYVCLRGDTNISIGYNYYYLGNLIYPILAVFIITGASNAYNLTDGLDGLAASTGIPTFILITIIANMTGQQEIAIISATVAGALFGFLKYNKAKAQVFMGDTGSLAIGGLMGTFAVMGKFEFLLMIMAGIFIMETLSVIIQVTSYKTTGKRVFKMAPLHHHFELLGYRENVVVELFTLLSCAFAVLAFIFFWFHYKGIV